MKTVEERAKDYADNFVAGDAAIIVDLLHKVAEESYIKGAAEQKEIDISTAMWAFWEIISPYFPDKDIAEEVSDKFRKVIEK